MSALTIQYDRGGVHLPELGLWLDPSRRQIGPEKVFVSHAHSDHSYSMGKSQELLAGLAGAGLPVALHEATHKITRIYEEFGCRFPAYHCLGASDARGQVVICPPHSSAARALRRRANTRTAVLTGWALNPRCRYRYQADAAFPLSDHADFPELIEMIRRVAPKKVYTLHGFAADFAQAVRDLGIEAQALSESEQFLLPLGRNGAMSRETINNNAPSSR